MGIWTKGLVTALACLLWMRTGQAAVPQLYGPQPIGFYISTGDNLWVGSHLGIESQASIDAMFDLLKETGVRRVYWRGLEQKLMNENPLRPQNLRYASYVRYTRELYKRFDPDKAAIAAAHQRGMEIWAVGKLNELGGQADAVPTNSWPFFYGSPLLEKYPVLDRYGVLHQGGTVSFDTPESRQAMMDVMMGVFDEYQYDGVMFLTYAENHTQRYPDEFGFNPATAEEFKKRHGIDPRFDDFTRAASRGDWVRLRGEYLSDYLRGLKARLAKNKQKLGLFINPWAPHQMQPWNVPEMIETGGPIHIDLEGLIGDGTLDQLNVYGGVASSKEILASAAGDLLWMVRGTKTGVSIDTADIYLPYWMPPRKAGAGIVYEPGMGATYFNRGGFPSATLEDLKSDQPFHRMRALQQIAYGQLKATVGDVAPLGSDPNPIVRSLAILALGRLNDPAAFTYVEKALNDQEVTVRCLAISAMVKAPSPQSAIVEKIASSVAGMPVHPVVEVALEALVGMRPAPLEQLARMMRTDARPRVAELAARALETMPNDKLLDVYLAGLDDSHEYVRYACTKGLGHLLGNPKAVEALIIQLQKPDDVVVNNRAALALEEIISLNDPAVAALRSKALAAVKQAYEAYGDGCTRADAQWGYRPVGDALLAFGDEGRDVLRQFMLQREDTQLAELAWKSLCIPHYLSRFDFATEAEDRRAFGQRPPSLRRYSIARVEQNFDAAGKDPGRASDSVSGLAGDQWSGLAADGSNLDSAMGHGGGGSLRLVRGDPAGNLITVGLAHSVREGANVRWTLRLRRDTDQSAFGAHANGSRGRGMGFFVDPAGSLHLWDGDRSRWIITEVTIPAGQWVQLSLVSDSPRHSYEATVLDERGNATTAKVLGVLAGPSNMDQLQFSPQGAEGTMSHVDDVELVAMP